ncbi:MAG: SMP-30/gluconolactonase/LRE family protein [Deltaproteobacteria bacterium]|nr:SMP-30/gluconolactonase/LRE family protein [Deltaproteobacteria bacterium]
MGINKSIFQIFSLIIIILIFCSCATSAEKTSGLIAPGAVLTKVQSGFNFTEGPAADAEGNVYFTDIPNKRIWKWTWKDGKISLYRENTGEANGLMFDAKGRMVVCEMGNSRVTLDDMKGNITVVADSWNGKKIHMPNDLWIDPKGGIYFSDFMGPGSGEEGGLQVYYISPDGKTVTRATDDLVAPNGLAGTPDGNTLYITDPGAKKTWSYKINADGALTDKKVFCEQSTDGFKLDEKGNLYFSGDAGVTIFSHEGKKIEEIPMSGRCSNLTFGGNDRKTLFITGGDTIYTLEMAVKGAPTPLDLETGKKK